MAIPEDIVNIILDELSDSDDDRSTLLACSVVARSFVAPSQSRLFRHVGVSSFQERCRKLHALLTQSPHIAGHIRILALEADWSLAMSRKPESRTWIFDEPALVPLLGMLPNLKALYLNPQHKAATLEWEEFPINLQASLLRLLQSPDLIKLELEYLRVPASIFNQSTHLKELRLPYSEILESGAHSSEPSGHKSCLKSLLVSAGPAGETIVKDLSPFFDLGHLKELILTDFDDATVESVASLIKQCAPTLERFQWTVPHNAVRNEMYDEDQDPYYGELLSIRQSASF